VDKHCVRAVGLVQLSLRQAFSQLLLWSEVNGFTSTKFTKVNSGIIFGSAMHHQPLVKVKTAAIANF
jgi:hypothetical protein